MIEFNICSRASGFLTTQFLELKQETPMVVHGADWVQRSAVWYHLHHDGHMDAELGRPCPTSMSPFDPSPRTKLLIPPSYHGTERHIIRVDFVFRSTDGDMLTWISQKAQSTILNPLKGLCDRTVCGLPCCTTVNMNFFGSNHWHVFI